MSNYWQRRSARIHAAIKHYYLKCGHTEAQWQTITENPKLFNAVWRQLLQLPPGDMPPPEHSRDPNDQ